MAKTVYAVNAGGNWGTDATWSTVSAKDATRVANTTKPVATDTVYIDSYSGSVTVDVASACAIVDFTGHTGTFTMNAEITTTGNVTLVAGMTFTPNTYTWNMGCATVTLKSGGKSFYNLNFNVTGTLVLFDAAAVTNNLSVITTVVASLTTSDITVGGNLTCAGTGIINGTRKITMTGASGTATWSSGGGAIGQSLTFLGGANTITVSGNVYFGPTGTLTYTSGVMALAGSTLNTAGSFTFTDATNKWVNINCSASSTLTLSQVTTISGNLSTASSRTLILATNDIVVEGNLTCAAGLSGRTITMTGASGTATWSSTGGAVGSNLIFLGGANTITVSGTVYYSTNTLTYTSGTMSLAGSTLTIAGSCIFTDATNTWVNINCSVNSTLTLSQTTTISGNLSMNTSRTLTLSTNNIVVGGNLTHSGSGSVGGTSRTITMTGTSGTATWSSGGGTVACTLIFLGGANTITVSGNVYLRIATLTYTSGVMTLTGSTLNVSGNCTFTDATNTWVDINANLTSATLALSQVTTISGNLSVANGVAFTISTNNIVVRKNVTLTGTGTISGASPRKITMNGATSGATWSSGGGALNISLEFASGANTVTVSAANVYFGGTNNPVLTYTSGTLVVAGTFLYIQGPCHINDGTNTWGTLFGPVACTLTLDSVFTCTNLTIYNNITLNISGENLQLTGNLTTQDFGTVAGAGRTIRMIGGAAGGSSWSTASGVDGLNCNLTIDAGANTVSLSGSLKFGGSYSPTLTYISGTVNTSTNTMTFISNCTVNTGTMSWGNFTTGAYTITLTGNLLVNKTLTITAGGVLACGTNNVTCNENLVNLNTSRTAWRTGNNTFYFNGTTTISSNATALGATFYNFVINAGKTVHFTSGSTFTATAFTFTGSLGNVITIDATTPGSAATISQATGTVTASYCSIKDSAAVGGATWDASNGTNTDVSGNTGWTFTSGTPFSEVYVLDADNLFSLSIVSLNVSDYICSLSTASVLDIANTLNTSTVNLSVLDYMYSASAVLILDIDNRIDMSIISLFDIDNIIDLSTTNLGVLDYLYSTPVISVLDIDNILSLSISDTNILDYISPISTISVSDLSYNLDMSGSYQQPAEILISISPSLILDISSNINMSIPKVNILEYSSLVSVFSILPLSNHAGFSTYDQYVSENLAGVSAIGIYPISVIASIQSTSTIPTSNLITFSSCLPGEFDNGFSDAFRHTNCSEGLGKFVVSFAQTTFSTSKVLNIEYTSLITRDLSLCLSNLCSISIDKIADAEALIDTQVTSVLDLENTGSITSSPILCIGSLYSIQNVELLPSGNLVDSAAVSTLSSSTLLSLLNSDTCCTSNTSDLVRSAQPSLEFLLSVVYSDLVNLESLIEVGSLSEINLEYDKEYFVIISGDSIIDIEFTNQFINSPILTVEELLDVRRTDEHSIEQLVSASNEWIYDMSSELVIALPLEFDSENISPVANDSELCLYGMASLLSSNTLNVEYSLDVIFITVDSVIDIDYLGYVQSINSIDISNTIEYINNIILDTEYYANLSLLDIINTETLNSISSQQILNIANLFGVTYVRNFDLANMSQFSGTKDLNIENTIDVNTGWFVGGLLYTNRQKITISKTEVGSTLTDFPIKVEFLDSHIASVCDINGHSIRFTSSSGALLAYERESYSIINGKASGIFWVKIPSISSLVDTDIYMYYRSAVTADGASPTNVWDSSFNAVWHFNRLTNTYIDSTIHGNNSSNLGDLPIITIGKVNDGVRFTGATKIDTPHQSVLSNATKFTISGWFKRTNTVTRGGGFGQDYPTKFSLQLWGNSVWFNINSMSCSFLSNDTNWHKIDIIFDGTQTGNTNRLKMMLDGVQKVVTYDGTVPSSTPSLSGLFYMGFDSLYYYTGSQDETRISSTNRSIDWLHFEYKNMASSAGELIFSQDEGRMLCASNNYGVSSTKLFNVANTVVINNSYNIFTTDNIIPTSYRGELIACWEQSVSPVYNVLTLESLISVNLESQINVYYLSDNFLLVNVLVIDVDISDIILGQVKPIYDASYIYEPDTNETYIGNDVENIYESNAQLNYDDISSCEYGPVQEN